MAQVKKLVADFESTGRMDLAEITNPHTLTGALRKLLKESKFDLVPTDAQVCPPVLLGSSSTLFHW